MRCFGGVFRRWLRGLGESGESADQMGRRVPFEQSPDRPAMRSSAKRMLTSRPPERTRLLVESSWVPGWPDSTWKCRIRHNNECTIADRIHEPEESMTRAAKPTQTLEFDRFRYAYGYVSS